MQAQRLVDEGVQQGQGVEGARRGEGAARVRGGVELGAQAALEREVAREAPRQVGEGDGGGFVAGDGVVHEFAGGGEAGRGGGGGGGVEGGGEGGEDGGVVGGGGWGFVGEEGGGFVGHGEDEGFDLLVGGGEPVGEEFDIEVFLEEGDGVGEL